MKVLIVDDSIVFRSMIKGALSGVPQIEVVGTASNGKIALEMIEQKAVDLVTLDMEMPVMGGLETLRALRQKNKRTKVVVFSSSTVRGSDATLEALASGANDFVAKPAGSDLTSNPAAIIARELIPKICQFSELGHQVSRPEVKPAAVWNHKDIDTFNPQVIVVASSTGGPSALETIFTDLSGHLKCPILIVQHMPPVFTESLARRLAKLSGQPVAEGRAGEQLENRIYVAPGDFHMTMKKVNDRVEISTDKGPQLNSVRPAADHLFFSAAEIFGAKCMAFVLTGMGEDGLEGSRIVKNLGGGVMSQSEASCVVYGMPMAVERMGLSDAVGDLGKIRTQLKRMALQ